MRADAPQILVGVHVAGTDLEIAETEATEIKGGRAETTGGGSTSTWAKIKSVWFGVDPSLY